MWKLNKLMKAFRSIFLCAASAAQQVRLQGGVAAIVGSQREFRTFFLHQLRSAHTFQQTNGALA